jgi:hypothetical protein
MIWTMGTASIENTTRIPRKIRIFSLRVRVGLRCRAMSNLHS